VCLNHIINNKSITDQTYRSKEVISMRRMWIPLNAIYCISALSGYLPYYVSWWIQVNNGNTVLTTMIWYTFSLVNNHFHEAVILTL